MTKGFAKRWLAGAIAALVGAWHVPGHAQSNLVSNPGFESGAAAWAQNATGGLPIITNDGSAARSGSWYAWLGGYVSGTDTLHQDIAIPADAQQAQLRFWYRIGTDETSSSEAYDSFRVALLSPSTGAVLTTLATFSNLTPTSGWVQSPAYDVSSFRGTQVRLRFQATNDLSNITNFRVDDVSLTSTSTSTPPPPSSNYSDIWWNPLESGWGLTIADHETQLFVVWYTYRQDGSPTWFVIPGGTFSQGRRIFYATAYRTTGPRYDGPFDPRFVTVTPVGSITLDFAPPGLAAGTALFSYDIEGVTGSRQIQRQPFGDAPPSWGSDYTDIWWDPNESGWGLTFAQHGSNVFGVWYTYDASGQPLFLVMPGVTFSSPTSFSGALYQTTGPYFGGPFDASRVTVTQVGSASVDMQSILPGNRRAQFRPTVRGVTQVRNVSPQPFGNSTPGNTQPQQYALTVAVAGNGSGSVVSNPGGIACPGTCAATFARGTTVTLSASPAAGSRFLSFTGTCSTPSTSCIVTMSAGASVTATFERLPQPSTLAITAVTPLPDARPGVSYSARAATATGGVPPYSFLSDTFANGAPPLGMIIDLNGFLTGTPSSSYTTRQTFTFGICVRDIEATLKCTTNSVVVAPAPQTDGTIRWTIGNECNNGSTVEYKFYDRARNWVWPDATSHYVSSYRDTRSVTLNCFSGGNVCLGARSGNLSWGVGYAGGGGCSNCCGTCDGRTYSYTFSCGSSPPPSGGGQCTGLLGGPRACQPCNSDADCGGNICWTGARPAPFCG